ncbi:unnamed protein product [Candidula unifasciata]|uniref:Uncharacterized protein n=1 Tax=Candidula unifasciata TaxID=100452 RepID=A0A8S3Z460_9EUPU|nr:unnamed protein product [Candidula unifasciata]
MAAPVYTDMNVLRQPNLSDVIDLGIELGFEQFAINYVVSSLQGGKGKKNEKLIVPPPAEVLLNDESVRSIQKRCASFKQLSRLTAVLEDASNTHRLGAADIQAYDIIAVQVTNEKTFQLACSTLDVDIICFNLSESLGFSLKRAMINLAAKRGIHFEIVYSPALQENTVKRNTISNAMSLIRAGGGKNVIISSGSEQPIDLRSPYDVINLARLFGLSHSQAKDAICRNCRAVLKHAESRKTCKSVVSVIKSSNLSVKEQWVLHQKNTREDSKKTDADMDSSEEDNTEDAHGNLMDSDCEAEMSDALEEPEKKKIKL